MKTIQEIEKQFENAGIPEFKDNRNLSLLTEILHDDETIEMACIGHKMKENKALLGGKYDVKDISQGLILATNVRVLYVNMGMLWGYTLEDYDYSKISSVEQSRGMLTTLIEILASGNSVVLGNIQHEQAKRIASAIGNRIGQSNKRVEIQQKIIHGDNITEIKDSVLNRSNVGGGSSKMQELKDLTEMKKEGLINDDEFQNMKNEILGVEIHERKKKVIKKKHPIQTITVECPDCRNEIDVPKKEGTQEITCSHCGLSGEV